MASAIWSLAPWSAGHHALGQRQFFLGVEQRNFADFPQIQAHRVVSNVVEIGLLVEGDFFAVVGRPAVGIVAASRFAGTDGDIRIGQVGVETVEQFNILGRVGNGVENFALIDPAVFFGFGGQLVLDVL